MAIYKLWTNARKDNAATAFMSAIKIQNHRWVWTDDSAEADLWCICADQFDLPHVQANYQQLVKKPPVAFLAPEFLPMPCSDWVYFRIPLNVSVLHNWLSSRSLQASAASSSQHSQDARWRHDAFKLNYWPNVSNYKNTGSEIMMVCSRLLHGWCNYDELLAFNVDKGTLELMLTDAVDEGNLVYNASTETVPVIESAAEESSQNVGLFKRIFSRFSKSYGA